MANSPARRERMAKPNLFCLRTKRLAQTERGNYRLHVMSDDLRIPHKQLVQLIRQALAGAGVPEEICEVEAELTAEADLFGVPSHGVRMLPGLLGAIQDGR